MILRTSINYPEEDIDSNYQNDGEAMKHQDICHEEGLAAMREGDISLCRCGIYHVRINAITLHLTAKQFDAAARLFKLAMGTLVGRRLGDSQTSPAAWDSDCRPKIKHGRLEPLGAHQGDFFRPIQLMEEVTHDAR